MDHVKTNGIARDSTVERSAYACAFQCQADNVKSKLMVLTRCNIRDGRMSGDWLSPTEDNVVGQSLPALRFDMSNQQPRTYPKRAIATQLSFRIGYWGYWGYWAVMQCSHEPVAGEDGPFLMLNLTLGMLCIWHLWHLVEA